MEKQEGFKGTISNNYNHLFRLSFAFLKGINFIELVI